jgi:ubiquinone/menaquinone biosynthesis C-methylase UbiE
MLCVKEYMQIEAWDSIAEKVDFNLDIDLTEFKNLIPKKTAILDYGCGYGRVCNMLNANGYNNIIGYDTSPEMIKRGILEYPHLQLYQNNNIRLEYPDCHFGTIIMCATLTCVPEYQSKLNLLKEVHRLLKTNGILHAVEFCSKAGKTFESNLGVVMNHQKPDGFKQMVSELMSELKFNILPVKTMSGKNAKAIRYFGRKIT